MSEFPFSHGFRFNDYCNEWQKYKNDGTMLILCEYKNDWKLSFVDKDDNLYEISTADEETIVEILKNRNNV